MSIFDDPDEAKKKRVGFKARNANIGTMNLESKQSGIMDEYYFTCVNIVFFNLSCHIISHLNFTKALITLSDNIRNTP